VHLYSSGQYTSFVSDVTGNPAVLEEAFLGLYARPVPNLQLHTYWQEGMGPDTELCTRPVQLEVGTCNQGEESLPGWHTATSIMMHQIIYSASI
jgi:hypothetical protein